MVIWRFMISLVSFILNWILLMLRKLIFWKQGELLYSSRFYWNSVFKSLSFSFREISWFRVDSESPFSEILDNNNHYMDFSSFQRSIKLTTDSFQSLCIKIRLYSSWKWLLQCRLSLSLIYYKRFWLFPYSFIFKKILPVQKS